MKLIKDIVTDNSGDFDIVSIMAASAFTVLLGLTIYSVGWLHKDFDLANFGIAVSALLASTGTAYHLKSNKEPKE